MSWQHILKAAPLLTKSPPRARRNGRERLRRLLGLCFRFSSLGPVFLHASADGLARFGGHSSGPPRGAFERLTDFASAGRERELGEGSFNRDDLRNFNGGNSDGEDVDLMITGKLQHNGDSSLFATSATVRVHR